MSFIDPQSLARLSMTANVGARTLTIGVKRPFRINLPDASNPGSYIEKNVTAPASVIAGYGHASPNFNMGSMGQTLAVDWLSNFPIFWHMTIFGGVTYFVASRNPCLKVMPAAAQIGHFGAAPSGTQDQGDAFVAATITTSDFAGLPVFGPIGSMPIQRAATRTSETIVALTAGRDGFGAYQNNSWFSYPLGQNGNTSGKYLENPSGQTAPTFTAASTYCRYAQGLDGFVDVMAQLENLSGGTAGSGAAAMYHYLPLARSNFVTPVVTNETPIGSFGLYATKIIAAGNVQRSNNARSCAFAYQVTNTSAVNVLVPDDFAATARSFGFSLHYRAFGTVV